MLSPRGARGVEKAELNGTLIQTTTTEAPQGICITSDWMCTRRPSATASRTRAVCICKEGKVGATRWELDNWIKTLPQPWTVAMEATIFTGWIYDHLKPHAADAKVAHPLVLSALFRAKELILLGHKIGQGSRAFAAGN